MSVEGILGGASLVGNASKMFGSKKGSNAAAKGFQIGGQQAESAIDAGYEDALKYLSPYAQMGEQTLPFLQQLLQAPNTTYEDYFKSPEYAALSQQQEGQVLRNASATGGLRSGNAQVALASIAPQLAMQNQQYQNTLQQQRFGNAFDLTRFGAGFGQNAAQMAMNRGNTLADYRYNAAIGEAGAQAQVQPNMFGNLSSFVGDIGSIWAGNKMGMFKPNQQQQQQSVNMTAPTYFTNTYGRKP
jgi:hypothetical protein